MAGQLAGKRVAVLIANGFEQIEFVEPKQALENVGAVVDVVSPEPGTVRGWNRRNWSDEVAVDRLLDDADADDYDALLLPGGVMNSDRLRMNPKAVQFVKDFFRGGKPIAVICHALWMLIEAEVVHEVMLTSYPSLKTDLKNAGAEWIDQEVVIDRGIVSARRPDDLPAFIPMMIEEFAEGPHGGGGRRRRTEAHA